MRLLLFAPILNQRFHFCKTASLVFNHKFCYDTNIV